MSDYWSCCCKAICTMGAFFKRKAYGGKKYYCKGAKKFNVSISEVDAQDIHQTIIIGIAYIAQNVKLADSVIDTVITFIENNNEAEILDIQREIR